MLIVLSLQQTRCKINVRGLLLLYFIDITLVLFAGLRYGNADYNSYCDLYDEIVRQEKGGGTPDIGFNTICTVLSWLSHNPVIMFFTVAFLSVTINLKSILNYTPYIFITILLYFVHNYALKDMIQIRAGLASALCLYSLRYIPDKKYSNAIAVWFCALSIHITCIPFGIVYLAHKLNLSRKVLLTCLIISLMIGINYPLGQIVKDVSGITDDISRLDEYVAYGDKGYASVIGVWTNANTIKTLLIASVLFVYYDRLKKLKFFYPLFLSYILGLCWLLCFNDFSIIAARISNILLSVEPVLLSYFYILFKPNCRLVCTIMLIIYSIIVFKFNIAPDKITDYKSVLSKY